MAAYRLVIVATYRLVIVATCRLVIVATYRLVRERKKTFILDYLVHISYRDPNKKSHFIVLSCICKEDETINGWKWRNVQSQFRYLSKRFMDVCGSFHQVGAWFVTVSTVTSVYVPSIILDYKCTFTVLLQIRMKSISPPSVGNYNNVN